MRNEQGQRKRRVEGEGGKGGTEKGREVRGSRKKMERIEEEEVGKSKKNAEKGGKGRGWRNEHEGKMTIQEEGSRARKGKRKEVGTGRKGEPTEE